MVEVVANGTLLIKFIGSGGLMVIIAVGGGPLVEFTGSLVEVTDSG